MHFCGNPFHDVPMWGLLLIMQLPAVRAIMVWWRAERQPQRSTQWWVWCSSWFVTGFILGLLLLDMH